MCLPRLNKRQRRIFMKLGDQGDEVVSSGWSFVSAILGQMTYYIACPTLDSAGSYVMQGAPFTQGTIPSISIGCSISPKGVPVGSVFLLGLLALAIVAACAFRAEEMPSVIAGWQPKLWLVFQMLTSFWEAFYQHKTTHSKNEITSFERDNDANDVDDDEREISWYYETIR
ncbi:hypothetical protein Tco_0826214 [Tanacetum coccineum]